MPTQTHSGDIRKGAQEASDPKYFGFEFVHMVHFTTSWIRVRHPGIDYLRAKQICQGNGETRNKTLHVVVYGMKFALLSHSREHAQYHARCPKMEEETMRHAPFETA